MTQQVQLPSIEFDPAVVARRVSCLPGFESAVSLPGWTARRIGKSAGNGTVGIFHVSGRAATATGMKPWSLVCKVIDERVESWAGQFNSPAVELAAYRSGTFRKPRSFRGLRAADCYGIDDRPDGTQLLWLEDLSSSPHPPWPDDIYISAARHVGQFNAEWSTRPLPSFAWQSDKHWLKGPLAAPAESWTKLRLLADDPTVGPIYGVELLERCAAMGPKVAEVAAAISLFPKSMGHCDCHPKNLFPVLEDGVHQSTAAVDWASIGLSPVGLDGGALLGSGLIWAELNVDRVRRIEKPVFEAYVEGLRDGGFLGSDETARLTYLTTLAADYGGRMALLAGSLVWSEPFRAWVKTVLPPGMTEAELLKSWRTNLEYLLPLLDEAVALARKIERQT